MALQHSQVLLKTEKIHIGYNSKIFAFSRYINFFSFFNWDSKVSITSQLPSYMAHQRLQKSCRSFLFYNCSLTELPRDLRSYFSYLQMFAFKPLIRNRESEHVVLCIYCLMWLARDWEDKIFRSPKPPTRDCKLNICFLNRLRTADTRLLICTF
jgi:hypothetical protein